MQPMKLDREQGDSPAQKDSYGEKSLIYLPKLWAEFIFPPQTRKLGILAPRTRDTGHMSLSGFSCFLLYLF